MLSTLLVELPTQVSFPRTKYQAKGYTNGVMVEFTMGNGKIIRCMVKENLPGETEEYTKGNTKLIKKKDSVLSSGQMGADMKETG